MTSFRRLGDERVRMQVQDWEAELLIDLRGQLHAVLASSDPDDDVTRRLFPPAVTGDDDADVELRGLIHMDLLESRLAGLDALVEVLERATPHRGGRLQVDLTDDEPALVLGVLNDLRLALGARARVEEIQRGELEPDDGTIYLLRVMDHLAGMQERLLEVLDPEALRHYETGHDLDD